MKVFAKGLQAEARGWSFKAPGNALAFRRVLSPLVARVVIANNPLQLEPDCSMRTRKRIAERPPSHNPRLCYIRGLPGPMGCAEGSLFWLQLTVPK